MQQEVEVEQEGGGVAEVVEGALVVGLVVEEVVGEVTVGVSEGAVVVAVSEAPQGVVDADGAASEWTVFILLKETNLC